MLCPWHLPITRALKYIKLIVSGVTTLDPWDYLLCLKSHQQQTCNSEELWIATMALLSAWHRVDFTSMENHVNNLQLLFTSVSQQKCFWWLTLLTDVIKAWQVKSICNRWPWIPVFFAVCPAATRSCALEATLYTFAAESGCWTGETALLSAWDDLCIDHSWALWESLWLARSCSTMCAALRGRVMEGIHNIGDGCCNSICVIYKNDNQCCSGCAFVGAPYGYALLTWAAEMASISSGASVFLCVKLTKPW